MAPLDAVRVSPHFTRQELNYDAAPGAYRANLEQLALLLERVRTAVGVPLRVTSGYRSPAANAALPGASSSSQHLTGQAADFRPVGVSVETFLDRLARARFSGFGQLIVYPLGTDHVHISLPSMQHADSVLFNSAREGAAPDYNVVALADSAATYARVRGLEPAPSGAGPAARSSIGGAVVLVLALLGYFLWRR